MKQLLTRNSHQASNHWPVVVRNPARATGIWSPGRAPEETDGLQTVTGYEKGPRVEQDEVSVAQVESPS